MRARRREGASFTAALEEGLSGALGPAVGAALAKETSAWGYGLFGWLRRRPRPRDGRWFTYHHGGHYLVTLLVLIFLLVVETLALHLMLERWSLVVAWVLTASSLYAAIWLFGDYHAMRLNPLALTDDALDVEIGLRWRARVPLALLAAVQEPGAGPAPSDQLDVSVLGGPNLVLVLREPAQATGFFGRRVAFSRLALQVDDPAALAAALRAAVERRQAA